MFLFTSNLCKSYLHINLTLLIHLHNVSVFIEYDKTNIKIYHHRKMVMFSIRNMKAIVPYEAAIGSNYVKEYLGNMGTNDITIDVPDKYYSIIGNYINYLQGKPTTITTVSKLSKCFNMASYFDDREYFQYLMQQTFNDWTNLSPVIYNETNEGVQREMFLYTPITLVPKEYMDTPTFFKDWLSINKNKLFYTTTNTN
jgi:hypothetical protein